MRALILLLGTLSSASAAVLSFQDMAHAVIPDGDSSGLVRSIAVNAPGQSILGVEVDIRVTAASLHQPFLGDLYIYLSNGTSLSALANRPGRRDGSSAGYSDNQPLDVTFSSIGADFHNYRLTVSGSNNIPLTAPLEGTWQADGRSADPAQVLDTSARNAGLDLFTGQVATGSWRLFAVDLSTGAVHVLESWTLRLTTVPEPGTTALSLAGALVCLTRRRS